MTTPSDAVGRIRAQIADQPGLSEVRMFGGVGFLLNGNLCCGYHRQQLIVRLGPDQAAAGLAEPHAEPFAVTGRPMNGWLSVAPDGWASDEALSRWVARAVMFVGTLPPKSAQPAAKRMKARPRRSPATG